MTEPEDQAEELPEVMAAWDSRCPFCESTDVKWFPLGNPDGHCRACDATFGRF